MRTLICTLLCLLWPAGIVLADFPNPRAPIHTPSRAPGKGNAKSRQKANAMTKNVVPAARPHLPNARVKNRLEHGQEWFVFPHGYTKDLTWYQTVQLLSGWQRRGH